MNNSNYVEAKSLYEKALQQGKKEAGSPSVLDEILLDQGRTALKEVPLGVQEINLDQIVGTRSEGRKNCFSKNFYPLMSSNTEFSSKWVSLCASHLEEGIHDPIKVYEYMNQYYVLEGNKRVSILKFFDSYSISADVIRVLPPLIDHPDILLYYEYVDFYQLSKINYLYFTKPQSFLKLQRILGKGPNQRWSSDDRMEFHSVYTRFRIEYTKLMGNQDYRMISDAFLSFLNVFGYSKLRNILSSELKILIKKYEKEFLLMLTPEPTKLQMDPVDKKPTILHSLMPKTLLKQKVAFIHEKSPELSGWTFQHDLGRRYLDEHYKDIITTTVYNHTSLYNIEEVLEQAILDNHQVIFASSPIFQKALVKASVEHPDLKFFNCTTHTSFKQVRTYYARMYEVKFLMGAIAGAMTQNDKVGYIADYPIHGTVSEINAFALGAKMVNPRVQIYLKWSKQMYDDAGNLVTITDIYQSFKDDHISILCDRDSRSDSSHYNRIGLYQVLDHEIWNLAVPIWNWSVFYEKSMQTILSGNWKSEEIADSKNKSIHYWWGMSSGLVDIVHSSRLPMGTIRLIELLKNQISTGNFNPFTGILFSQTNIIQGNQNATLSPEQILSMDWLADNVIGEIPQVKHLDPDAKIVASFVGIDQKELIL